MASLRLVGALALALACVVLAERNSTATAVPSSVNNTATPAFSKPAVCKRLGERCGGKLGKVCANEMDCCSALGFCGNTPYHCLRHNGCQEDFTQNKCKDRVEDIGTKDKHSEFFGQVIVRAEFNAAPVCPTGDCISTEFQPAIPATKTGKPQSPAKLEIKAAKERLKAGKLLAKAKQDELRAKEAAAEKHKRKAKALREKAKLERKAAKYAKADARKDDRAAKAAAKLEKNPADLLNDAEIAAEAADRLKGLHGAGTKIIQYRLRNLAAKLKEKAGKVSASKELQILNNTLQSKAARMETSLVFKWRSREKACLKATAQAKEDAERLAREQRKERKRKEEADRAAAAAKKQQEAEKQESTNKALKERAAMLRKLADEKKKIEGLVSSTTTKIETAKKALFDVLVKEKRVIGDLKEATSNGLPVAAHKQCVTAVDILRKEKATCKTLATAEIQRDCISNAVAKLKASCAEYNGWRATKRFAHRAAGQIATTPAAPAVTNKTTNSSNTTVPASTQSPDERRAERYAKRNRAKAKKLKAKVLRLRSKKQKLKLKLKALKRHSKTLKKQSEKLDKDIKKALAMTTTPQTQAPSQPQQPSTSSPSLTTVRILSQ